MRKHLLSPLVMAAVAKNAFFFYFLLFGPGSANKYENGLKDIQNLERIFLLSGYISSIFSRMRMTSQNFDQVPFIKNAYNLNLSFSYGVM